jgi:hypothetical protein
MFFAIHSLYQSIHRILNGGWKGGRIKRQKIFNKEKGKLLQELGRQKERKFESKKFLTKIYILDIHKRIWGLGY